MGIAGSGRKETEEKEKLLSVGDQRVKHAADSAASACHSLGPADGREAGATGSRLPAGAVQQEGVAQLAGSKLQHLQTGTEDVDAWPVGAAVAPENAATTPSTIASSIATVLCTISGIFSITAESRLLEPSHVSVILSSSSCRRRRRP